MSASRRHKGGAGDILAIGPRGERWLIEAKTTSAGPFADFGPKKRQEMREACARFDCEGWLVWRAPGRPTRWVPLAGWPLNEAKGEKVLDGTTTDSP